MQHFSLLFRLAWRSLWREYRRSLVLLSAITLGVWAMIAMAAFFRGWLEQQLTDSIDNLTGHVQIHAPGFRDDPVLAHSMAAPGKALRAVLDGADVSVWGSRVRVPAVVVSERESAGVSLIGIQPDKEQTLSFIARAVKDGRYLENAADDGLLLGKKLAERLETGLGKRVVVMTQGQGNEIADRGFRVVGIFDATVEEMETAYLFTGLQAAQRMLGLGEQISEIAMKSPRHDHLEPLVAALRQTAPDDEVLPWLELEPLLKVFVGVIDAFLVIWYVIVFLLMSFGLINTLLMAVFERTREIGLLLALGMQPRWILGQVLLESVMLLLLGLVLGNALVALNMWWLSDGIDMSAFSEGLAMLGISPILYPALQTHDVVIANVVVLLLGIAASLYPAWHAARTVPVDAINQM